MIDKVSYEKIHALRASEVAPALAALKSQAWADSSSLILAGTSEGSVPVARYPGKPVLNVISSSDPFFSRRNTWLSNPDAQGHCGAALKGNNRAAVLLVPDAPHTLLNFAATRSATAGFLALLKKP